MRHVVTGFGGGIILVADLLVAIFAPLIAPHDPLRRT